MACQEIARNVLDGHGLDIGDLDGVQTGCSQRPVTPLNRPAERSATARRMSLRRDKDRIPKTSS
jgi:hypothetical protein